MDLAGNVGGNPVMIRESPTLASTGQTTITDVGGGNFRIHSFFDVFTELSLDNGNTWIPQANGPTHVELGPVPEPTTMIAGALMLIPFGLGALRSLRAKQTA